MAIPLRMLFVVVALATAACATTKLDTPSGKPQVVLKNVPATKAKQRLTQVMIEKGYVVERESQHQMVFLAPGKQVALLAPVRLRVTYSVVEQGSNTQIVAEAAYVTAPGSEHEDVNPATRPEMLNSLQDMLLKVQQHFGQ